MDVAATRWRATCCAVAATCGASGQARFPHLPCTSPSSEQGWEPDPGALCACVSVSADGMGDPGQGPSFASGCRPSPPNFPPLATELLSEGPAPRQSYFYLFTVRATSSLFLPSCPPPTRPVTAFCSGPSRPRAQGRGGGGAGSDRHGVQTEDAPLCAGVRGRPGVEGQDAGWPAATGGGLFVSLKGLGCSLFGVTGGREEWHPWGVRPAKQPCFWPLWSLRDLATWIPTGVFSHSPPQSPRP